MIRIHNTEPDFFGELGLAPTYVKPAEMFVARPKKKSGTCSCMHDLESATMAHAYTQPACAKDCCPATV